MSQETRSDLSPHSTRLRVSGMTCASCAARVESALRGVAGVGSASVSASTGLAIVEGGTLEKLTAAVEKAGYGAIKAEDDILERLTRRREERIAEEREWRKRLWLSLIALPAIILGMGSMFGLHINHDREIQLFFGVLAIVILAPPFYISGFRDLINFRFNMDSLVSVGSVTAFLASIHAYFFGGHLYFEDAVAILAFLTLGRYLEARAKAQAESSIGSLASLIPRRVIRLRNGVEEEVDQSELAVGDLLVIKPGGRVPADGVIVEGLAEADESLLTGEALPVAKGPDGKVIAGSVIHGGRIVVRVEGVGQETRLSEILREMDQISEGKTGYQALADRAIAVFMPVVLIIAAVTFFGWWIHTGEWRGGVRPLVAVLVIACPCALGIATPIAISVGAAVAARRGILLRDASALDRISGLKVFVFDKTGSVTRGEFRMIDMRAEGIEAIEALSLAAAVESASEHPLGKALVDAVKEGKAPDRSRDLKDFRAIPGRGVEGTVGGWTVTIGSGIEESSAAMDWTIRESSSGRSVFGASFRKSDGVLASVHFSVEDTPRSEAREVIENLKSKGYQIWLISGDREESVRAVAGELGCDGFKARVLPSAKVEAVRDLRRNYGPVAMIGDGVNDGPALAESDFGIAMGGGTAVAATAGAAVLLRDDLRAIETLLDIGEAIRLKATQNIFWAFAYNVILIPAAAFALLPPMAAAFAMAFSDVTVIGNALRLWRFAPAVSDGHSVTSKKA